MRAFANNSIVLVDDAGNLLHVQLQKFVKESSSNPMYDVFI
jgi:hypothetical protein